MPTRRNKKIFSKKHDYRGASIGPSINYQGRPSRRTSSSSSRSRGSYSSRGSHGGLGSTGSLGSRGSLGSLGSRGSLGSTGSLGSRGSLGSTGSLGSRNSRNTRGSYGSRDARNLDFNSSKINRRATRGEISHVVPNTSSRESMSDFSRRSARRGLDNSFGTTSRLKTFLLGAFALIFAALVAVFVGSCVYNGAVNGKMGLEDDKVKSMLVSPESNDQPYYVLLSALYSEGQRTNHGADMLMLVRVDEPKKSATFINVPASMVVNGKRIGTIARISSEADMIEQLSGALGVDIAHYIRIDSQGFVDLIDGFGGIEVDVKEEVDDPDTGDLYIPAGKQTMDGATALVYLRGNNYSEGNETRAAYQMKFLKTILKKVLDEQSRSSLDSFASCIQTDYTADEALRAMSVFSGAKVSKFVTCSVPGSYSLMNGKMFFYPSAASWDIMKQKIEEGSDPSAKESVLDSITPSDYKIEIRNGANITGAAAEAKSALKKLGFRVGKVGNTESAVYNETLVIYKKSKNAKAAQAVVEALGVGRTVENSLYYKFKTDILLIIGKDWRLEG